MVSSCRPAPQEAPPASPRGDSPPLQMGCDPSPPTPHFRCDVWGAPPGKTWPGAGPPGLWLASPALGPTLTLGSWEPASPGDPPSPSGAPPPGSSELLGLRAMDTEGCSHSMRSSLFICHLINVPLGSRSLCSRSQAVGCGWAALSCQGAGGGDATGGTLSPRPQPCVTVTVAPRIQCPALVAFAANVLGAVLSLTYIPTNTKGTRGHGPAAPPGRNPRLPTRHPGPGRPAR